MSKDQPSPIPVGSLERRTREDGGDDASSANPWAEWLTLHGTSRYSLGTKRGWIDFVNGAPREDFATLSRSEMDELDGESLVDYNEVRGVWHANAPVIKTPQLQRVNGIFEQVLASSHRDGDSLRGSVVLDSLPGLGKTTAATRFGRTFDRRQRRRYGHLTAEGSPRLPVAFIPLTANMSLKNLNQKLLRFYDHPAAGRATRAELGDLAVDCVATAETRLIILDDLHFINFNHRNGMDLSNHLKWLANEMPATFVYVGVGLSQKHFFDEGLHHSEAAYAQTSRRATRCTMAPFNIKTDGGMRAWVAMLQVFEGRIKLADAQPGCLTEQAQEIFRRTQGYMVSVTNLIDRACSLAISTGAETIDSRILASVVIDNAAEDASTG